MDALQQALANANINHQLSNPTAPPVDYIANQPSVEYPPHVSHDLDQQGYQIRMEREYAESYGIRGSNITPQAQENVRGDIIKLSYMIEEIRATITKAASEVDTTTKHRSLSQWSFDDILTELIERENDLNPYYFELLKRISNPEILSRIDECMNAKMHCARVLSLICSTMNSAPSQ